MSVRLAFPSFTPSPVALSRRSRVCSHSLTFLSNTWVSACLFNGASSKQRFAFSPLPPAAVSSELLRLKFQKHPVRWLTKTDGQIESLPKRIHLLSNGAALEKPLALSAGLVDSRFGLGTNLLAFAAKKMLTSSAQKPPCQRPHPGHKTAKNEGESAGSHSKQVKHTQKSKMSHSEEQSAVSSTMSAETNFRCGVSAGKKREGRNPALRVCENFLDAVGMTPLIKLRRASQETHCDIFAKCEFNNPGGSVKDRPAKYILEQAEKEGRLGESQKWIVEGSAGNTAIGLALASKPRGYRVVCVIPETQTQDKKDMLKVCGALLVEVPFHKVWHPDHFVAFSGRLASVLNACWGNQFDNLANQLSHYETTGPEIWDQMDGRIDGFVSAAGTGGTISGVSCYLRSQHPEIQIALADIPGSALYRYYTQGVLRAEGSSVVENIGQGRITGQLRDFRPDVAFEIPDVESLAWTHFLLEDEGLAVGMSSGVNVAAAVRLAKRLGPGHRIVTVLCDSGTRYAKKQWNISFLKQEGLPCPRMLADQRRDMSGIMEAIHVAYAPQHEVEKIEKEHEHDISSPGSKL